MLRSVAALRIVLDVAWFRLRRLEMANLVAAGALLVTLHAPWADLLVRGFAGALLNLLVYLNNDYHDIVEDLEAASKDQNKNRFLHENMGAAVRAQLGMLVGLVGIALWWDLGLLVPIVAGGGICWAYSAFLKRRPVVDVLAMVAWGATMPAVAFSPGLSVGWVLVGQLALISGSFESVQVLRDHDEDLEAGVQTTAVLLGKDKTWWLIRAFIILCAAYSACFIHRYAGLLPLLALFLPRTEPSRYWNGLRGVMGVAFLSSCAQVYLARETWGWLGSWSL
jgi:4-hydroxybenzoate polyprenyltransferase